MTYDISRSWEDNCRQGPRFERPVLRVPPTPYKEFLGFRVRSRLGIAAGLLPNCRWIVPYAERGFDLLTYKTVRSEARPAYPLPNWVFVDDTHPPDGPVRVVGTPSGDPALWSSAVCFGMPSAAPETWREDVRNTVAGLGTGKVLIVSVVGTPGNGGSLEALAADFARCAAWAAEAGAHAIEANLSCPNVCSAEGTLCQDPAASRCVLQAIRDAIGSTPLLAKIGTFASDTLARRFVRSVADSIHGLTLVNCISRPVLRPDGQPAFGPEFRTAGVLGRAIHRPSVDAVYSLRRIVRDEQIPLTLAAVGGVSTVQDAADFFEAGADAVLFGSSPMYLPDLAVEMKRTHPEW